MTQETKSDSTATWYNPELIPFPSHLQCAIPSGCYLKVLSPQTCKFSLSPPSYSPIPTIAAF